MFYLVFIFFLIVVTMQAPRTASLDFECKDKFLIQSTVVSAETSDEDITASMVISLIVVHLDFSF